MTPRERARASLLGLSVGDALGQTFFVRDAEQAVAARRLLPAPWMWTDDTAMATSVVAVLEAAGEIDEDLLARDFGARYAREPARGYGGSAHAVLQAIAGGAPWRAAAASLFDGQGSMGNGGAMRAAPIGAFFADDVDRAAREARRSAAPTHAHPEGAAGAVAAAVAAALAGGTTVSGEELLREVAAQTPAGATREGLERAATLGLDTRVATAAAALGNGMTLIAADTVPFAVWCAARHLDDFEAALWTTIAGLGDRDTTAAIVGGIVASRVGVGGIPAAWIAAAEPIHVALVA